MCSSYTSVVKVAYGHMFQCYHTYVYLDIVTKFVHKGDHFTAHTMLLLTLGLQTVVHVTDTVVVSVSCCCW